jgi:hypothetical protein
MTILPLNVVIEGHATLSGIAATRIRSFAERYDSTVNPFELAAEVMTHIWQGDPHTLVLLLVDEQKTENPIVGHLLCEYRPRERAIFTIQAEADEHSGGVMREALAQAEAWGQAQGARQALFVTHHDPELARRWNPTYKVARTVMMRPMEAEP